MASTSSHPSDAPHHPQPPPPETHPKVFEPHSESRPHAHASLARGGNRRFFVGPYPERVISHAETQLRRSSKPAGSAPGASVFSLSPSQDPAARQLQLQHAHVTDKLDDVTRILKDNAFKFFVHEGGDPGDWGEEEETHVLEHLMDKWKESEWGKLWSMRHQVKKHGFNAASTSASASQVGLGNRGSNGPAVILPSLHNQHWFGTSFEVGTLMGVDILNAESHLSERSVIESSSGARQKAIESVPVSLRLSSYGGPEAGGGKTFTTTMEDDFVTAPLMDKSTFGPPSSSNEGPKSPVDILVTAPPTDKGSINDSTPHLTPTTSRTELLASTRVLVGDSSKGIESSEGDDVTVRPKRALSTNASNLASAASSTASGPATPKPGLTTTNGNLKGKARAVRYLDQLEVPSPEGVSTPGPAPPGEVLQRTKETVDPNTSLAASTEPVPVTPSPSDLRWGEIVLRDRMLVRVSYTKSETLPALFDEHVNRTTRDLSYEDWGEFLVVWRKDSIEIYRDHSTPGKEWITGHKHLDHVIPLKGKRTKLSLYSYVDMSFCITCAPTKTVLNDSKSRWTLLREKEGTNVFVFKLKTRSRACDWMWLLWRHMGGRIPGSVDVYNPRMSTKATIDIPGAQSIPNSQLYRLFDRENVISLCTDVLRSVPDWKYMLERELKEGKSLQLAWRRGVMLDWIWLEEDILGKRREWAVLCGLAFKQPTISPVLEIRVAEHEPTHINLKDGKRLEEPPSIEGYLDRIRPNTQTKQQVYLVTHNGNLFLLSPSNAYPPTPPGMTPLANLANEQGLRQAEIRRGINQILYATGVCELRTIVAVRRAFMISPTAKHDHKEPNTDNPDLFNVWSQPEASTAEDEEDEGGEPGLMTTPDRSKKRMRRSFELLMNTGYVVRLEAYSCKVAVEWIERLRALIFYWKSRHRIDAKQEIEVAQAWRPRLTPQTRVCQDQHELPPEPPSDLSAPYPAMDTLYNWCILEGCRPVVKSGKVYVRKGLRGQYKLVQLFLVAGHLLRFRIDPNTTLHRSVKSKINLLDAYVTSGYYVAQTLPKGQYTPDLPRTPRRYQDGLETDDRDEDMLFMLWYHPQPSMTHAEQDPTTVQVINKTVPTTSGKHKVMIFKTRSSIERDSWCWAINSEIEKVVRTQRLREDRMREEGNIVQLGS